MRAALFTFVLSLTLIRAAVAASDADAFYAAQKAGHIAAAIAHGEKYLAAHPRDNAFAMDLAYAYVNQKDVAKARAILAARTDYIAAHPKNASIWLALSYIDSDRSKFRDAIADADHYLRYFPDDANAWKQRDYALASTSRSTAIPAPDESAAFYAAVNDKQLDRAIPLGQHYLDAHPDNVGFALDLAFAYLGAKDLDHASAIETKYDAQVVADPEHAKILPALFYAYNEAGLVSQALTYGRKYLAIAPGDDQFAMDLAYAELKENNVSNVQSIITARAPYLKQHNDAAKLWLEISYKEADVHRYPQAIDDVNQYLTFAPADGAAIAQRTEFERAEFGGPRMSTFADSYYDGRFDDTFLSLDTQVNLGPNHGLQPYVTAHLSEDTKSGAPGSPQVFNDNVLVTDAGVRASLGPHASVFAEAGYGIGLRGEGTITDARYGFTFGDEWTSKSHATTSADASVAFYSRYEGNIISYYDVLHIFPGREYRPLIGINGGYDGHNVFGNRYLEGLYGFQVGHGPLTYRVVGVEGTYLGAQYIKKHYSSLRAMLILGLSK